MRILRGIIAMVGFGLVAWGVRGARQLPASLAPPHTNSQSLVRQSATLRSSSTSTQLLNGENSPMSTLVLVKRVIDGDTIELETGERVRYIGVNAPETVDPRKLVECFGHEASEWNRQLVQGKMVRLVKDISEVDRYDRLLRYVYLSDGAFVNVALVTQGYGYADTFPPDVRFSQLFRQAQREAREKKKGLWAACQ